MRVRVRIGGVVIQVGMTIAAGIDDLARAQNGTAATLAIAIPGSSRR